MREDESDWLVAGNGIHRGQPGGEWTLLGAYRYTVNQMVRQGDMLVAGCGNGLWEVPADRTEPWVQQHDETLTEVMAVAETPVGIAAGSPYGVAISRVDHLGSPRWRSLTEHLRVNARFTNAILVDPTDASRWVVGTEGGVIVGEANGTQLTESSLNDSAVRSVIHTGSQYVAGSDRHGVHLSEDGLAWQPVDGVSGPVFCVASSGDRLIAGTDRGLVVIQGGHVTHTGPTVLVRCLGVDPDDPDTWLAGADPGGIWVTSDAGVSWQNYPTPQRVRHILAPERD